MTHYHSITIGDLGSDTIYPDNIIMYGKTDSDTPYITPVTFELVHKYIEAVISSDDFSTWDYTEEDVMNTYKVWSSDGTAIGSLSVDIEYCYANIALEIKPVTRDGVVYYPSYVGAVSSATLYTATVDVGTVEYVGTSINKTIPAELSEDSTYIVKVPYINSFTQRDSIPVGYKLIQNEFIIMIYEDEDSNLIRKIQPIYYKPNE